MDPALLKIQDIWDRHVPAALLKIGNQRGPFQKILKKKLYGLVGKNPTAMKETQVQSSGQEDPLEKGMTIHSSILAWKIPGQRSLAGSMGLQRIEHG